MRSLHKIQSIPHLAALVLILGAIWWLLYGTREKQ